MRAFLLLSTLRGKAVTKFITQLTDNALEIVHTL